MNALSVLSVEKTLSIKGMNHKQQDPIPFWEAFDL